MDQKEGTLTSPLIVGAPIQPPSVKAAVAFAETKLPRSSTGTLLDQGIEVGSHLRGRDAELIARMATKSEAPPYVRKSGDAQAPTKNHSTLGNEALDLTLSRRYGHDFSRRFGVGVSLYMKMLRLLTYTYIVMGLFQLPLLVSFISGTANVDAADESSSGGFEVMSLANVPQHNETLTWGSLSQRGVFIALTWFDCASISIFMAASIFLLVKTRQFDTDIDLIQTTPADYTVIVENIPGDVDDANEIKAFFESLLIEEMR